MNSSCLVCALLIRKVVSNIYFILIVNIKARESALAYALAKRS